MAQQDGASYNSFVTTKSDEAQVIFDPAIQDWPHSDSDLKPDPRLIFGRLDNGLRYIILPIADPLERVSMRLQFSVGARDETEEQYGIAHFVEHMTFRGFKDKKTDAIVKTLQRMGVAFGAGLNAFTNYDTTIYHFNFPNDNAKNTKIGLSLFNEIARGLAMDEDDFEAERGVVLAESGVRDTPRSRADQSMLSFLYPDIRRYKYPMGGNQDTIKNLNIEDVRQFYNQNYRPENAIIVISGKVNSQVIEKMIAQKFGDWQVGQEEYILENTNPSSHDKYPDMLNQFKNHYEKQLPSKTLNITGFPKQFESYSERNLASKMITVSDLPDTLTGDNERMQKKLFLRKLSMQMWSLRMRPEKALNKKLTWVNVAYSSSLKRDQALMTIGAARYFMALPYVDTERRRAVEYGFLQWELDRVIQKLRIKLVDQVKTADKINAPVQAQSLIAQYNAGTIFQSSAQKLAQFDLFALQFTLKDYHDEFKRMWADDNMRIWIQSGKDYTDDQEKFFEELTLAREKTLSAFVKPKSVDFKLKGLNAPGILRSRVHNDKYEFDQLVFENGVRLNFRKTSYKTDQIDVKINLGIGFRALSEVNPNLRHLTKTLNVSDHKKYSKEQLAQYFEEKKIGFTISVGGDRLLLYNNNLTQSDLQAFFENMTDFLQNVDFDSGFYLKRAELNNGSAMRKINTIPLYKNLNYINHSIYPDAAQFPAPHRIDFTKKMKRQLREILQPVMQSGPIEIGIAGDFDEQKLLNMLENTLGALPPRAEQFTPYVQPVDKLILTDEKQIKHTYFGKGDQSAFHYCWPFTRDYSLAEYERIKLLQEIVTIKINDAARQRDGEVYTPNTVLKFSGLYKGYGFICAGAQISADKFLGVEDTVNAVGLDMYKGNISRDEFVRAQKPFLAQVINATKSNSPLGYQLAHAQSKPEDLVEFFTREDRAKKVRLATLKKISRNIFNPENAVLISTTNAQADKSIFFAKTMREAKAGDVDAQIQVAEKFLEGGNWNADNAEVYPEKAVKWLEKAAEKNSAEAHYRLAVMYGDGKFVPLSKLKQREHFKFAANAGHSNAQYKLASLYIRNFNAFPDVENAEIIDLLQKSAHQGNVDGQRELARRLTDGAMIERDVEQALVWLLVADKLSNAIADSWRTKAYKHKVSEQTIEAAKAKADDWVEKYYGHH